MAKYSSSFDSIYSSATRLKTLTSAFSHTGQIASYSYDKAFFLDVEPSNTDILTALSLFHNIAYFDTDTELAAITINSYNYNKDAFVTIRLYFEQGPLGSVFTSSKICVINQFPQLFEILTFKLTFAVIADLLMMLIILLYIFISAYGIYKEIRTDFRAYFTEFFNVVRFVKIFIYIINLVFTIIVLYQIVVDVIGSHSDFIDTSTVCNYTETLNLVSTVMICLTLIYFLKFLDESIIGPFINTLLSAKKKIMFFVLLYFFSALGFAAFCNYVFGIGCLSKLKSLKVLEFRSLDRSVINLYLMIFGDFTFISEMSSLFPSITLFFTTFFAIAVTVRF